MYLRAWLDPAEAKKGQHVLWVYKQGLHPKRKGTKAVGAETAFYLRETAGAENATEPQIGKIETVAAAHLAKLRSGDIDLSDQERAEFATFMGITKFRTKFARELMNATAIEILRQGFEKTLREGRVPKIVADFEKERGKKFDIPIEKVEAAAQKIADGTTRLTQESKGWSSPRYLLMGDFVNRRDGKRRSTGTRSPISMCGISRRRTNRSTRRSTRRSFRPYWTRLSRHGHR